MGLITISRQAGSLGDEIARLLASELSFTLLDQNSLEENITKENFPEIPIEKYDEHFPSFWENFSSGKDIYLDRLRTTMLNMALKNKTIILGRGGQNLLANLEGIFHLRIIASNKVRIKRIQTGLDCDKKTAERFCRKSDHDRSGFSRFFFDGHWGDPDHYDVVFNTDRFEAEEAAAVLKGAFLSFPSLSSEGTALLKNRLLAQEVRNEILYHKYIPVDLLVVEVDQGAAIIKGTVLIKENIERCKKAAMGVEGIKKVSMEVYYVNPMMTY